MIQKSLNKDTVSLFSGPDAPLEDDMYKCVHCGFCLQVCPTYLETGLETESPRGRIALMKAVNEKRITLTPAVYRHWDLCIQCRACEVACPSGVPYGNLIQATMSQVNKYRKPSFLSKILAHLFLNTILPSQRVLSILTLSLRMYQQSGIQWLARRSGLLKFVGLSDLESSSPRVSRSSFKTQDRMIPAQGKPRAKVGLVSGCVMPLIHAEQMNAMVKILTRNGCDVEITTGQTCCGAIHSHVGELERSRELARINIDVFESRNLDAVISASAGCGTLMKEYGHLLREDPSYADRAEVFSKKVKDIHEFLVDLPFVPPTHQVDKRVTYQDSCHLANSQRVTEAPRILLRSIPGLDLVELPSSNVCCGAGGTYSITERDFSQRVLDSKMENIASTKATIVATANPGCIIQLEYGATRTGSDTTILYVTDLLYMGYGFKADT